MSEESQFGPPRDSLIPPGHSTGTPSPIRGTQRREQKSREPPETTPTRRAGEQGGKTAFKSPHSPDQESQKEERDSVIDCSQTNYRGPDRDPRARENDCRGHPRVPLGYGL